VRRKGTPGYQSEQVLFRQMLNELVLPQWCRQVIVVADAAYDSRENLRAIQARHWWFVIAFPRTWKFTDDQSLRDLVRHLPSSNSTSPGRSAPSTSDLVLNNKLAGS
jgi:Transposase DDE domain